jgi:hypothetical protein
LPRELAELFRPDTDLRNRRGSGWRRHGTSRLTSHL